MELVELKRVDRKKEQETAISDWPRDDYPVSMYVGSDQLDQLGVKSLEVGSEMIIQARVRVSSFSSSETSMGEQKSASLNVEAMAIMPKKEEKSAAQAIYGGSDGNKN